MSRLDGQRFTKPLDARPGLPFLAVLLCLSTAAALPAQTQTAVLEFESEALDLETGEVIDLADPLGDTAAADFHFAYNADRATHAVLLQEVEAEIALMSDTPFETVTASDIPSLAFTTEPIDHSCDGGDTVVLRTSGGSVYKIGNLLEDPAAGVVVFDFELLESPQAAVSPAGPAGPLPGASAEAGQPALAAVHGPVDRERSFAGLSAEAARAITAYIERDLYGVRSALDAAPEERALEAANPAQAYRTRFTPEGIRVQPRGADAELGLTLTGCGYGEALSPLAPASPRADGQRVEYARGALTEWYVNRSSGLEQGFTLSAPVPGARDGAGVRLEITLSGSLVAESSGDSISFRDASGSTWLHYGGLVAWDAAGRVLPAEMRLLANRLILEVDDAAAVYPVTIDPTIRNEVAKLLASDGVKGAQFGSSVAMSGDTVVVGDDFQDYFSGGPGLGAAYVFEKPTGGWTGTLTEAAKLIASDGASLDQFGRSVSVSGGTVVVGARYNDGHGLNHGAAYLFEEPAGGWAGTLTETAKLLASDAADHDRLGSAVAVSGDTVVATAPMHHINSTDTGAAYVFEKPAGGWSGTLNESARLLASDGARFDLFGSSAGVSGGTIVIGANRDDDNGSESGAAYVFEKPAGGWSGTLNEAAKLLASDGATVDYLGWSAAVSGETVVVGANLDDDHGTSSGSAYVFEKPVGGWSGTQNEDAKLLASDGAAVDFFGWSVAISADTVAVGALLDDDNDRDSGSAYVFEEPAGGWAGIQTETAKLLPSAGMRMEFHIFGSSIAVSDATVVTGALNYYEEFFDTGAAYVFDLAATCSDADGDGLGFPGDPSCPAGPATDNCPDVANPGQEDEDGDGEGDACDANDIQALCGNTRVGADDVLCQATLPEASVDGNSFDPDGDPVTTNQIPADPYPLGPTFGVELEVDDVVFGGPDDAPAICLATIDVVDRTPPTLAIIGDPMPFLQCSVDGYNELGAEVSDACDPDVSVVITGDPVDPSLVGVYDVLYDATDASGNVAPTLVRHVTVQDTLPPTIVPNGDPMTVLECRVDSYVELGAVGLDECDPLIDPIAVGGDVVSTGAVASFIVTYDGFDDSGNLGVQAIREVSVIDTTPPSIALNPGPPTVECNRELYNEPGAVATDLCDPDVPVAITGSVDETTPGSYTIAYDAADDSGNPAPQATRPIEVQDTIAPLITPNAGPSTLECNVDTYVEPGATLVEACDPTAGVVIAGSVDESVPGPYAITYDASDVSGNAAVRQVRSLTVADTLAPTITLVGGPLTLECAVDAFVDQGATATDVCDPAVPVVVGGDVVDPLLVGGYSVSYDATDASGNMAAMLSRAVTVQDTRPPAITPVGDSVVTLECGVDAYTELGATGIDDCDPLIDPITIAGDAVSTSAVASFTVTYDGSDDSGNPAPQAVRTIDVLDTTAPVITPNAGPSTLECNVDTYVEPGATLTDACDPTAAVVLGGGVDESAPGAYAITYDASDGSGNVAVQQVRNLTVADTLAPTITLVGGPLTLECAVDAFTDPGATATDACDPAVVVDVGGDTVDAGAVGIFNLTYDATDASGNMADPLGRQVTVEDTTAPVITPNAGPSTLECNVDSYVEPGATLVEACDPTAAVVIGGGVDESAPGPYAITYDASDVSGNVAIQQVRNLTVADTLAPTITVLGDPAPTLECGVDAYVEAGASASDACDPSVAVSIGGETVDPATVGVYNVTYDATDAAGNAAAAAGRSVTVVDTLAPAITCPAPITLALDTGCEAQVPDLTSLVTAVDDCSSPGTLTITQDLAPGLLVGPGSHAVTVTATDASGNAAQCQTLLSAAFAFDGFLPPIDGGDATGGGFGDPVRSFKLGSTVPVKFRITCDGVPHLADVHTLQAIHYTTATDSDPPIDATPQDAATTGNEFRLSGEQWHYNLDTEQTGMSKGQWQMVATLSDGTTHYVWIQVK